MRFEYDPRGTDILSYGYDTGGRLTSRWSLGKGTTYYSYDAVGNLMNANYPSSTDLKYAYDALNRMTNMTDAAGTTKFTYYAGGALNTEDGPWSNDTLTYVYGAAGELKTVTVQQPSGSFIVTNTWDAARRLKTVTSPAGQFSYTYTNGASGLAHGLAWSAGPAITNRFDGFSRLTNTVLLTNGTDHPTNCKEG